MSGNESEPLDAPNGVKRAVHHWVRYHRVDYLFAVALLGVWIVLGLRHALPQGLSDVPPEVRRTFYQSVATLAGTMAGFTLTSVSVLVNLLRTPVGVLDKLMQADDRQRIGDVFLQVLPRLTLALVVAGIGIVVDSEPCSKHWWIGPVVVGAIAASLSSLARVVWVLRRLLGLSLT